MDSNYNNENQLGAKNFEDNSNNHQIESQNYSKILNNNKNVNKDKVSFFKFLIYSTKAEIHINSFKDLLFWVSLCEIFLFILCVLLFLSATSKFYIFWVFTTHLIRGILGLLALFRIPDSYLSLENIERYDSSTLEALQRDFVGNYLQILQENEPRFKSVLIAYFVFTIINILGDNIIFFGLIAHWNDTEYSVSNVAGLLIIVVFFGKGYLFIY